MDIVLQVIIGAVLGIGLPIFLIVKLLSRLGQKLKELPREENAPREYYSIIEDAGFADEISYEEYVQTKNVDCVLFDHKKTITVDSKDDAVEELLEEIPGKIPGFTFSYEKKEGSEYLPGYRRDEYTWIYVYTGDICGEPVHVETEFPHFVPDVLNPILSRKYGKQLLFAFPGSDQFTFILVDNEHAEKLKENKYFGDYKLIGKFYGYTESDKK